MDLINPIFIAILLATGGIAGFLAGLLGIGGGIVIVPILMWVYPASGFPEETVVHLSLGTSLAVIIFTTLSATLGHNRNGNVNWNQVLPLALSGVISALLGSFLAAKVEGNVLKILFGVLEIIIGFRLFYSKPILSSGKTLKSSLGAFFLVGGLSGLFSSFFGVGGGIIAVPLMLILLSLPAHLAIGNSCSMIVFISLFGTLGYIFSGWDRPDLPEFCLGYVNYLACGLISFSSIIFAQLGVKVSQKTATDKLKRYFSVILILVGIKLII
ncbi:MAG: sulfite exporter TauE/SafE family protein [Deltaproteobacteria bacterium]|nr:MAG: sulfite exporter TauE/SafE family protein [Deltaproteobacteria bacterium]